LRFAYADPPYIGCSKQYKDHPDYAGEVDHRKLLDRLYNEFPDGWLLSSNARGLWDLLPMISKSSNCRIAVWCQPFGIIGGFGTPQHCWEPVIFRGGRKRNRGENSVRDYLVANTYYAMPGHKGANKKTVKRSHFPGAKPDEFCYWIFDLLNMQPGDELVDLFPGTGRVTRAWERYQDAGVSLFVGGECDERSHR